MPRSGEEARGRLQQAALELFSERGYEQTTAAEIAARAGVTERTFFRHFADKREVLFDGQAKLRTALTAGIAGAPEGLQPLEMLHHAFRSVAPMLEHNRPFSVPRQRVIDNTPALQEREMAKTAALAEDLAAVLGERGARDLQAMLAAQIGMTVFVHAILAWFADPARGLGAHIDNAFVELGNLAAPLVGARARHRTE